MELGDLRSFVAVARAESVRSAARGLGAAPSQLSKAVARLEAELGAPLFTRERRVIRLTEAGRWLRGRAIEILRLEEAVRLEIAGEGGTFEAVLVGPESLLARFGMEVARELRRRHPKARLALRALDEHAALAELRDGGAHLALVTLDPPAGLAARVVGSAEFVTCVGSGHPLHARARAGTTIPVAEVLRHVFASPSGSILGRVGARQSVDGWRDDRFPRKIGYVTSSLRTIEELVSQGLAVAYLPDHCVERARLSPLRIAGCPYHCTQRIRLVARDADRVGWIRQLL